MSFMKEVEKTLIKSGIPVGASSPPGDWISTGSYALNKIISGSFMRGIPTGRLTVFCGPSQSGKSFNVANLMREAQQLGMYVCAIDSENALDDEFVGKLGVNVGDAYSYVPVGTIDECKKSVSNIIQGWKKMYTGAEPADREKVLIVIDSLNMLMTSNEQNAFEAGENKGDFGSKNKQLKSMLQSFTNNIRGTDIAIVSTAQVYANQDLMNGKGLWIVSDAVQYSASQIVLVTKLNLKDKIAKTITGIRMKCFGFKSRFSKPFESVTIEVPYFEGMDPFNGMLDIAVQMGVVTKAGAWYTHTSSGEKFQSKNFINVQDQVLVECEALASKIALEAVIADDVDSEDLGDGKSAKKKRKEKFDDAQASD